MWFFFHASLTCPGISKFAATTIYMDCCCLLCIEAPRGTHHCQPQCCPLVQRRLHAPLKVPPRILKRRHQRTRSTEYLGNYRKWDTHAAQQKTINTRFACCEARARGTDRRGAAERVIEQTASPMSRAKPPRVTSRTPSCRTTFIAYVCEDRQRISCKVRRHRDQLTASVATSALLR